jgi:alkanesulfonate monooxygenase SsuD/methylene tetrahydromethanopterin reductase-like flavin-dependent oxidoreductase (luciferase family)
MRFSYIAGPRQNPEMGQTAASAWRDYVDDVVRAEELGFDAAFIGEHHFCYASGNSSPLVMCAHMAARTQRIRIGTSVICAPFHNPLRLAEDIAAVDIVSNGRFDLGIGVGSQWEEFQAFHIDPEERFGRTWEIADILEKCLNSGERYISHQGKYYSFPQIEWIMQPVQKRIPFFWGGMGPQGARKAGERGYHLIAQDGTGEYAKAMRAHGRRPEDALVGFVWRVSIAPSREEAFQAYAAAALFTSNQYAKRPDLKGQYPPASALVTMADIRRGWDTGERVAFCTPGGGTVDDVIRYFLPVVRGEQGLITHIGIEFRPPGVKTEDVARSMSLFAKEVMPVLRAEAAKQPARSSSEAIAH